MPPISEPREQEDSLDQTLGGRGGRFPLSGLIEREEGPVQDLGGGGGGTHRGDLLCE